MGKLGKEEKIALEEKLIGLMRERPWLYDKKHPDHLTCSSKGWEAVASYMAQPGLISL